MPDKLDRSGAPDRLDLAAIERKTYGTYDKDGLVEIFGGLSALYLSSSLLTEHNAWLELLFMFIMIFVLLPLLALVRQKITYPRVGFAEPSGRRQARAEILGWAIFAAAIALILWGVLSRLIGKPEPDSNSSSLIASLLFSGTFPVLLLAGAGWWTTNARWYAYSVLTLVCLAAAWLLHVDLLWGLGCAGALIVLSGSVVLWRFVRRHPVLGDGVIGGTDDRTSDGGAL